MTETIFYTLLALLEPNHGYGIMKFVRELTEERVKMGTGTLYTMLGRLVDDKMITVVSEMDGKKTYQITEDGKALLIMEQERLEQQCANGEKILREQKQEPWGYNPPDLHGRHPETVLQSSWQ